MARTRNTAADNGSRLLDLWSPGEDCGVPIGCVATTFTLDAGHFEEHCLARFVSMETDPAESARAYLIEREEKLSQVYACVMADQRHAHDAHSLRWRLLPVRLPGAAIQHAKLSLLVWEHCVRVIVTSANLTPAGYRLNREIAAGFDLGPDGGAPASLVLDAIAFLRALAGYVPTADSARGPRASLLTFLADARRRASRWPASAPAAGGARCELVSVLPGGNSPSVPQRIEALWRGPVATRLTVLSPFFDQTASAIDRTHQSLAGLLAARGSRAIAFRAPGRRLHDGTIEVDLPERLARPPHQPRSLTHEFAFVDACSAGDGDAQRPLHAKGLHLESDDFAVSVLGSSNCTVQGLGLSAVPNAEVNVAYVLPSGAGKLRQACEGAWPPAAPVPPHVAPMFLAGAETSDATDALALLPRGFVEALFSPTDTGGVVTLTLSPGELPATFEIRASGRLLMDDARWATAFHRSTSVELPVARALSELDVAWVDDDGNRQSTSWVVNVTDAALLPPPDELRNLKLEDLLAVLTSREPAHRFIERLLASRTPSPAATPVAVDPHDKVDTSQFLMRRMRRLAHALEGLRARLEQPVCSADGLRWRLNGPLGALALTRALQQSGEGAAFFMSEVVAMLDDLRPHAANAITRDVFHAEVAATRATVKGLALVQAASAPPNLRDYVAHQLTEPVT
jgi:hypothetical protein